MYHNDFHVHRTGWGVVAENDDTILYILENSSPQGAGRAGASYQVPAKGGCFGFVCSGLIAVSGLFPRHVPTAVHPGQYFTSEGGIDVITVNPGTKCVIFQAKGYTGASTIGQLEEDGRLGYIDGCRDTVLHGPLVSGLPCLNALFMPTGIHQTSHTHPSTRAGVIFYGAGQCETPDATYPLQFGDVFFLPPNGWHKFRTDLPGGEAGMRLVAYHPDSDFGPTNDEHPMLNRTEVDGVSAKHIPTIQTKMPE